MFKIIARFFILPVAALSLIISCKDEGINDAISKQLAIYPESRVQVSVCAQRKRRGADDGAGEAYHPHYRIIAREILEGMFE